MVSLALSPAVNQSKSKVELVSTSTCVLTSQFPEKHELQVKSLESLIEKDDSSPKSSI